MPLPPFVTLEEHFFSSVMRPSFSSTALGKFLGNLPKPEPSLRQASEPSLPDRLFDLGPLRLASMDVANVRRQVISHAPEVLSPEQCRLANDELAAAVATYPDRFTGFAELPVGSESVEMATELRRAVRELGFVGALIPNHANGTYYDGEPYAPLWTAAEELDVPVYLHPTAPTGAMKDTLYRGNYSTEVADAIGSFGFGWHSDVAVHVLKLFAARVFDRHPKLKIVIGHFGEMLPYMIERVERVTGFFAVEQAPKRPFRTVWDENIWITTSGVWSVNPMACLLRNTKIERILYSVDYPFAKNENGLKFMNELKDSGLVTEEQLERIAYKNAIDLLGLSI